MRFGTLLLVKCLIVFSDPALAQMAATRGVPAHLAVEFQNQVGALVSEALGWVPAVRSDGQIALVQRADGSEIPLYEVTFHQHMKFVLELTHPITHQRGHCEVEVDSRTRVVVGPYEARRLRGGGKVPAAELFRYPGEVSVGSTDRVILPGYKRFFEGIRPVLFRCDSVGDGILTDYSSGSVLVYEYLNELTRTNPVTGAQETTMEQSAGDTLQRVRVGEWRSVRRRIPSRDYQASRSDFSLLSEMGWSSRGNRMRAFVVENASGETTRIPVEVSDFAGTVAQIMAEESAPESLVPLTLDRSIVSGNSFQRYEAFYGQVTGTSYVGPVGSRPLSPAGFNLDVRPDPGALGRLSFSSRFFLAMGLDNLMQGTTVSSNCSSSVGEWRVRTVRSSEPGADAAGADGIPLDPARDSGKVQILKGDCSAYSHFVRSTPSDFDQTMLELLTKQ